MIRTISSANWSLEFGIKATYKCTRNHTYWGLKTNWVTQSKMDFKICEGILCTSLYVNEFDVLVHNKCFSWITLRKFLPCCIPNHLQTWWLRWELGIVTRSYCFTVMRNAYRICIASKNSLVGRPPGPILRTALHQTLNLIKISFCFIHSRVRGLQQMFAHAVTV